MAQINGAPDPFDPTQPISARMTALQIAVAAPQDWDYTNTTTIPDQIADAVVAEMRSRVIGIKDDADLFHADYHAESHRQAALNEVLELLQEYAGDALSYRIST